PLLEEALIQLKTRLQFLIQLGLGYLHLDRKLSTLSHGETQRVRLAKQLGSHLRGILYVLDEPTIGLHPHDITRLNQALIGLKKLGNTILMVEHDEETIRSADFIVDFGPKAGNEGGKIVCMGELDTLLSHPTSITGAYLSGRKEITFPEKKRLPTEKKISLQKASLNNLKNVDLTVPLGLFVVVTGVSGSGKSSLITETLTPAIKNQLENRSLPTGPYTKLEGIEHIDKIIAIDQSPIGRTPRSNPATYIKIFDEIRLLYSQLPDARAHGFTASR
ncbi:unnamed protein product, partial [marine sediment metagenome]